MKLRNAAQSRRKERMFEGVEDEFWELDSLRGP